jgi:hypothetical protein
MIKRILSLLCSFLLVVFFAGCSASRLPFNANGYFPKSALQKDYALFRNILEDAHPSLYWYTPKDSMDYYFDQGYQLLSDSMNEPDFRKLLAYVVSKVNCGHTTVKYSKKYARYLDTLRAPSFPLMIKLWDDSAVVNFSMNREDSILRRGTVIKEINHLPFPAIRDSLFQFISTDGYSINHKYQQLSNTGGFGNLYKAVFGLSTTIPVTYIDSAGIQKNTVLQLYDQRKDTLFRRFTALQKKTKTSRKQRRLNMISGVRNIQIDTSGSTALMSVNSFAGGNHLKSFFRRSFRVLRKKNIQHLIIDLRLNGGGNVGNSTLLTQYITKKKFRLTDSLFAIKRLSRYEKHIQHSLFAAFFMNTMTKKKADDKYHFGYFERHYFMPRKKNHFNGQVYFLTGGNSFSASTLVLNMLKGQSNVTIVGEETGGGAYGNSAWFIPDVTLPNTRLRFRLPRFRLVVDKNKPKDGRGVLPDVEVKPVSVNIKRGIDAKMEYVKSLIYGPKKK